MSHTETSVAEAGTGTVLTHPLDEFYRLAKRPLPGIKPVDGAALPEPYRSLLVHERDMTSTLGQFHGFFGRFDVLDDARTAIDEAVAAVREHTR